MIISQTPLRMSFVGGGSDLRSFYSVHGGAVLSTAINKYVFVNVNKKFDSGIRIAYSRTEDVSSAELVQHRLVKATLLELGIQGGIEITTIADIPAHGTGLGSSSAFAVGLLNALSAHLGTYRSANALAELSCRVEIDRCREPIGKQDQYASAFGGFNIIEFAPNERVQVTPVIMPPLKLRELESNIMMFYTGKTRSASSILRQQNADTGTPASKGALLRMVELTHQLRLDLQNGNIESFGPILDENWQLKRTLAAGVTNAEIDDWYAKAIAAGASGGKILGAGAGGFLIFYAVPEKQSEVEDALKDLRRVSFRFEATGSRIIYYNPASSG